LAHDSASYVTRALDALRDHGCKVTAQRTAIAELFGKGHHHWTPHAVFEELEPRVPSLSLATVYNTMDVFEEIGLVRRVTTRDGCTYFDTHLDEHHHAVCEECGELIDVVLGATTLQGLLQGASTRMRVRTATIWFRGVCEDCA
jgi:Fur family peroxide stress response transcriptional regulator